MNAIRRQLASPAMIVACVALIVALGGVSYAAAVLPKNSVGSAQLQKHAVSRAKLKRNAVTAAKVKDGSLLAADFKAGQIPVGPQGPKGSKGDTGARGLKGDAGEPATKVWAFVNPDGSLRRGRGVVSSTRTGDGAYKVTFAQSIESCVATASYMSEPYDGAYNPANSFAVYRWTATTASIYIFNSSLNSHPNIPFALIVVC